MESKKTMPEQDPHALQGARDNTLEAAIGREVHGFRKKLGMTVADLSAAAGISVGMLSKIENGQMSPTYEALKKLAEGLEISVPQLFTPPKDARGSGRMALTRAGEGEAHPTATYEHELLAGTLTKKAMLPYRARVRARSFDEFDGWVRHDGEEFLYVLTGAIRLITEFYEPFEMRRGDSAYYDASMGHNVISVSDDDATILWVTSL